MLLDKYIHMVNRVTSIKHHTNCGYSNVERLK